MRLREKEISDPQTIDAILQSALVCRIALAAGNAPYVVPVNFAVKDGVLYFHSALSGRKIDMLQQNASVCFEVDFPGDLIAGEKACSPLLNRSAMKAIFSRMVTLGAEMTVPRACLSFSSEKMFSAILRKSCKVISQIGRAHV